mgnify:CR=1 FL=1
MPTLLQAADDGAPVDDGTLAALALAGTQLPGGPVGRQVVDAELPLLRAHAQALADANEALGQYVKALGETNRLLETEVEKHARAEALLRGSIDEVGWGLRQVGQTVSVSWIQPRVLNKERVGKMRQKFAEWQSGLDGLFHFVTEYNNSL